MNRAEKKRLLKTASIAAIVIILLAVALSYIISGFMRQTIDEMDTAFIDESADMALGRVDQTSTRNGRDEWRLTADVATFRKASDMMDLSNVTVYFYLDNGETGTLTADNGWFLNASQNFGVNNNVKANLSGYNLETARLEYIKDADLLKADEPVTVTSGKSYLKADTMQLEVKNNKLFMEGNVKVFLTPEFMQSPPSPKTNN